MYAWLKKILGNNEGLEPTIKQSEMVATSPKEKVKITVSEKVEKIDLDSMKKNELLAHAKANGVKANASMNKAALITAIQNG